MTGATVRISTVVPTITIFVRHRKDCPRAGDEFYKKCRCFKHLRWYANGKLHRKATKTRTWSIAEEKRRELEAQFAAADPSKPLPSVVEAKSRPTIERAMESFISDKGSQGLDPNGLKKYTRELTRFSEFMSGRGKFFPHEIELADLTDFRSNWSQLYPSSTTRSKVQERLRALLRYCYESRLIDRVPKLSPIKVDEPPTLPLTAKQYARMLKVIPDEFTGAKATRVHALVRLMRHSGLAIRDAVTLERGEFQWDNKARVHRVVTNRQKTGTHVSVPIPPDVATEIIAAMPLNDSPKYIFWNTGTNKPQTAVTNWQHDLRQVFRAAGMEEGHPHQLRDTFAVEMLNQGIPLEEVSKLLGHTSIKTTEKSYAPWVKARQERLDSLVIGTWAKQPPPSSSKRKLSIVA